MRRSGRAISMQVLVGCVALQACSSGSGSHDHASTSGSDSGAGSGSGSGSSSGSSGSSSGAASSSGSGSSSGGIGGGQTCDSGACNTVPTGLLNPDYTTAWNPGILADTPTGNPLGDDGLPVRTTTCATVPATKGDATSAIQKALDGCQGKNQVVMLAAGTFSISSTVTVPSGVVLRGAGSDAASGTTIVSTNGGAVLSIGTMQDTVCYGSSGFDASAEPLLSQDAAKETATVTVASASGFMPGDLALIDQLDDSEISEGDCTTIFKRTANYGASERVEIASVSGNTVTLSTPLHWTFKKAQSAQISRVGTPAVKWAGIESVLVQGGRPGSYAGQNAGGIDVSNAAYSWVKDVQVDGTTSGMPIRLAGTYRCVIRDSHFHNSYSYGFAQDNYGIVLACGAADDLVENNIARFMNKPILFNNSGGGNVVGYNYADNSWSCDTNGDDGVQEISMDCHCAFPHMELVEGNWAPHMGATITHGNAGYLTYFRNYASTQWSPSTTGKATSAIVWGQPFKPQYSSVGAFVFQTPDVNMTVIGNVLGSTSDASLGLPTQTSGRRAPARTPRQRRRSSSWIRPRASWPSSSWTRRASRGRASGSRATSTRSTRRRCGTRRRCTANLPASTQSLPDSLYYAHKPAWWPAGTPWPWVGPDLSPDGRGSSPLSSRDVERVRLLLELRRLLHPELRQLLLQRGLLLLSLGERERGCGLSDVRGQGLEHHPPRGGDRVAIARPSRRRSCVRSGRPL